MAVLGPGGFDAKRDIAAIAVNRWAHGYAYEYNPLYDPWNVAPEQRPNVIGSQRFGRIAIANSDSGAAASTACAIEPGHRPAIGSASCREQVGSQDRFRVSPENLKTTS